MSELPRGRSADGEDARPEGDEPKPKRTRRKAAPKAESGQAEASAPKPARRTRKKKEEAPAAAAVPDQPQAEQAHAEQAHAEQEKPKPKRKARAKAAPADAPAAEAPPAEDEKPKRRRTRKKEDTPVASSDQPAPDANAPAPAEEAPKKSSRRRKKSEDAPAKPQAQDERPDRTPEPTSQTDADARGRQDRPEDSRSDRGHRDDAQNGGQRPASNQSDGNRQEDGRRGDAQLDSNRPEGNREDGNRPDGNRPEGNRPDGNRQDGPRQESGRGRRKRNKRGRNDGGNGQQHPQGNQPPQQRPKPEPRPEPKGTPFEGMLEMIGDKKFGFIRGLTTSLQKGDNDPFMPPPLIEKFNIRDGAILTGELRPGRKGAMQVTRVDTVMGEAPEEWAKHEEFDSGVVIYPDEKVNIVAGPSDVTMRVVDLVAPIGKGQRALIVAPPRSGKTIILKKLAAGIAKNHENIKLVALLIDERPEEVTDFVRNTKAQVFASSNDFAEDNHVRVATLAFEYARRMVEQGQDVVILLDSLTRLGRTFNLWGGNSGRTMSGGLDARALVVPRRIFGSARNIEGGGSLTIVATALVETGSRMDDVIFEEFKGTGNAEIVLDRELSEKRIYPAINLRKAAPGTRSASSATTRSGSTTCCSAR